MKKDKVDRKAQPALRRIHSSVFHAVFRCLAWSTASSIRQSVREETSMESHLAVDALRIRSPSLSSVPWIMLIKKHQYLNEFLQSLSGGDINDQEG